LPAVLRGEARIWSGGVEKDITFVDVDHDLDDAIDAAYRDKYRRYGGALLSVRWPARRPQVTTVKLAQRSRTIRHHTLWTVGEASQRAARSADIIN
jgi:hypothetical protein